jgi:GT2 family glycosyltransferase
MRVSVIVPVFNGLRYLPPFFDSLANAVPANTQLVLVDDASTEPIAEAFPTHGPFEDIVELRNPINGGYSVAVNRGFAAADGDVVIQLNTDLLLDGNCIHALLSWLQDHPNAGILGSKLLFPTTGRVQHVGMTFGAFSRRHLFYDMPAHHPLCGRTRKMQIVSGATVAMTRPVLNALGPLDERYYNYNEDIDHCLRAVAKGFDNYTVAGSVAYHWLSQSGPARFSGMRESEALFWNLWGEIREIDLGVYVDEGLDHILDADPRLQDMPFKPLNLCRSLDEAILLERIDRRWPGAAARVEHRRARNRERTALWLGMDLPSRMADEPSPYLYIVDRTADLAQNRLWFETRLRLVEEEIILDLTGAIFTTREFLSLQGLAA